MPTSFNLPTVPTTPEGGLAGFFRGTQYNYGLADLDRQFRDQDLTYARNQNLYNNEMLDNPVKVVGRDLATTKGTFEKGQYDSGFIQQQADSKLAHEKAQTEGIMSDTKVKQTILQADAVIGASETLKNTPGLVGTAQWNTIVQGLKDNGIKIPDNFVDNQANRELIHSKAGVAYSTRRHLQERELAGMKESAALQGVAMNNAGALERTRVTASAMENKPSTNPATNLANQISAAAKAGMEVSIDTIDQLATYQDKKDATTLEKLTQSETTRVAGMKGRLDSPKKFDEWVASQGLVASDYKTDGKYDLAGIGAALAKQKYKAINLEEAWEQGGKPRIPASDLPKVKALDPTLYNKMERNNKEKGGFAPTAAKAAPAQTPGKAINVADVLKAAKLKYPSKSEAELLTALEKAGLIPKQTSTVPVDSHAVPTQAPNAPQFAQTPLGVAAQALGSRQVNLDETQPNQSVMYE